MALYRTSLRVLNNIFAINVSGQWLTGVALYWETPFEITYGVSLARLLWMQCEGGGQERGTVSVSDCSYHYMSCF
jgi:hypothetical protein